MTQAPEDRPKGFQPMQPPGAVAPRPMAPQAQNATTWALMAHLSALAGLLLSPVGWIVGPLIVWLIKKDEMPLVDHSGRNALNFQITFVIAYVGVGLITWIVALMLFAGSGTAPGNVFLPWSAFPTFFGGLFLIAAVLLALVATNIVFVIMASMAASRGQVYRYPVAIQFLKPPPTPSAGVPPGGL